MPLFLKKRFRDFGGYAGIRSSEIAVRTDSGNDFLYSMIISNRSQSPVRCAKCFVDGEMPNRGE